MTLRVIVRPEAKHDIREARQWYRKISPLLGNDFIAAVESAINAARERPAAHQVVFRSFRRVVLHRFPYSLFYDAGPERVIIVAVLHQARDPDTLNRR